MREAVVGGRRRGGGGGVRGVRSRGRGREGRRAVTDVRLGHLETH